MLLADWPCANAMRAATDLSSAKKADILARKPVRAWAPPSASGERDPTVAVIDESHLERAGV